MQTRDNVCVLWIQFADPYAERDKDERSQTYQRRQSDRCVIDEMRTCMKMLESLLASLSEVDPAGSVENLMRCNWFGEISLMFPVARTIRIPLLPPEGSRAPVSGCVQIAADDDLAWICVVLVCLRKCVCLACMYFMCAKVEYVTSKSTQPLAISWQCMRGIKTMVQSSMKC